MVRDKEFYKTIFRIALPSAFQALVMKLVGEGDKVMSSWLTKDGVVLGAVNQADKLTGFFSSIMFGIVSGSAVLISQYWGRKDTERIKQIFSIVIAICVSLAVLVVTAISLFPGAILSITIGADKAVTTAFGLSYLRIVCFSYLPFAVTVSLVGMLRSVEAVRVTLVTSLVALFTDLWLNYCMIFGHFGFPAMGVRGAALSTVISRVIELSIVWVYAFHVQTRINIKPKDLLRSKRWLWRDYARHGLPVAVSDTQWALVTLCKAFLIGRMVEQYYSANAIAESIMGLGLLFTGALSGGAVVVIGKVVGTRDYAKARAYSNTIQVMFAGIGLFMSAVIFSLRGPIVYGLYGVKDANVAGLAMQLAMVGSFTMIGTAYHASCFTGINRGAGDTRFVMIVDMICGWGIVLPLMSLGIFVFHWPMPVIFLCTYIDQTFKWIIAFIRLRGNRWIHNVTRDAEPVQATEAM